MPSLLPAIGDVLGEKYRLDGKLGEGGFAVVYAATTSGEASVALKVLKPNEDGRYDSQTRARFEREVAALRRVNSASIVDVLDSGETPNGLLYAVFERVPGQDLSVVLGTQGRLEPEVAEHVLRQLLHALRDAHRAGVLHRDIKPENVRVFRDGGDPWRVKLLDFGIARPLDDGSPSLTKTGELIGTPRYMSPEQLTEKPLTPASDLYSLGMVAFELLAGRGALPGGSWGDQLDRLQSGYQFVPDTSELGHSSLLDVIRQMTERRAGERFQTAEAALTALDGHRRRYTEAQSQRQWKWLAAVGVSIAVVLVGFAALFDSAPDPVPQRPRKASIVENPLSKVAVSESDSTPDLPKSVVSATVPIPLQPWESEGCGTPRVEPPTNLVLPGAPANEAVPLVVLFHDVGVNHVDFLKESGFVPLADEHSFAVLSLSGRQRRVPHHDPWKMDDIQQVLGTLGPREAAKRTIGRTLEHHCIDLRRIYAVGHGAGVDAMHILGCGGLFDGTAAVASLATEHDLCAESLPRRPRIKFLQLDNPHTPLFGGPFCAWPDETPGSTLNEDDEALAQALGCMTEDPAFKNTGKPQSRVWTCEGGSFESHLVRGGRPWPGVPFRADSDPEGCHGEPAKADYASRIWSFFDREWRQRPVPLPTVEGL